MSKTYENLQSSAINSIKVEENVVKIVYQTNIDKEYSFDCENTEEFEQKLCEELISIETNTGGSVGKFLYRTIADGTLVPSK